MRLMVEEVIGSRVSVAAGRTLPGELTEAIKANGRGSEEGLLS